MIFFRVFLSKRMVMILCMVLNLSLIKAQCNLLCNDDFENNQVAAPGTCVFVNASLISCWSTTAADNLIEVWRSGFLGVPSYSGNQFIELNANLVSTIYQDFTAAPGTSLSISFAHRGRSGVDVMNIGIGPVGGPYTILGSYSDGQSAWGYYTVNYIVPGGQGNNFSLRFNSVSATGGNPGIGNFLDAISVNLPIPSVTVNNSTICSGQSTSLTAVPSPIGGTYAWNTTETTQSITVSPISTTNYSVIYTLNGCPSNSVSIPVTVVVSNAVSAPSSTPLLCINTVMTNITHTTTGATGIGVATGLPAGVTATWAADVITIIGTPTESGTFYYTIPLTGGCGTVNATGTITVNSMNTIAEGTSQTVCLNTAIATISLATTEATGATFTGLPAGVTGSWLANTVTISGTPTASGTFNYIVTTIGGCPPASTTGTITVTPLNTIAAGTSQTVCINTAIATISLATTEATGATFAGLPAGVTGSWLANTVTISGTPTASGAFNYTVTTIGGCPPASTTGTITVNPLSSVNFIPDTTMGCIPLTVNFTNLTLNSSNCVWSISNGTVLTSCNTVMATFSQPGCFDVTLTTTATNGCVNSFTALNMICVEGPPLISFTTSGNNISSIDTEVMFYNNSVGAIQYLWNFGDLSATSNIENPTHLYAEEAGTYPVYLVATSTLGCVDTVFSVIQVTEELLFFVPNTFSPNYDDFNPIFKPIFTSGFDPMSYTMLISNRWGEVIFETHNTDVGWTGSYGVNGGEIKMVQDGTYTWKIEFKANKNDERKMFVGHVNIIR